MRNLPFVLGLLALAVTAGVLLALSGRAAETDYQATFFQGLAVGGLGGLVSTVLFHVAACRIGRKWLVPGVIVACIITAVAVLRFEGFSGEMIPRLAWRWSSQVEPPAMKTTVASITVEPNDESMDDDTTAIGSESGPSDRTRETPNTSLGFLGTDRNGIYVQGFSFSPSEVEIQQAWTVGVGLGWSSFAVDKGLAITIEERSASESGDGAEEWITAYDLVSGDLRWKHAYAAEHFHALGGGGPRSTPQIDGDAVFVQGALGDVNCLSLADGQLRWHVSLLELAGWTATESEQEVLWGRSGSPMIVDDLCIVPFGAPDSGEYASGRSLIALNKSTGEVVWTAGEDQISYASPQLISFDEGNGDLIRQIVIVNERTISGHNVADGKTLWSTVWEGDSSGGANCASVVAAGKNQFLIGKGYGGGSALLKVVRSDDQWDVETVWTSSRLMKTKFNHAVVVDDVAYGISNGAVEAIEISTAERLWLQPRRDRCGQGQVILAGDTLIVQNEDGSLTLVAATPDEYKELRRVEAMHSKTWNIPTLAGSYLLVRNSQTAICFELKQP